MWRRKNDRQIAGLKRDLIDRLRLRECLARARASQQQAQHNETNVSTTLETAFPMVADDGTGEIEERFMVCPQR